MKELINKINEFSKRESEKANNELVELKEQYTRKLAQLAEMKEDINDLLELRDTCLNCGNRKLVELCKNYYANGFDHKVGFCSDNPYGAVIGTYGGGCCEWGTIGVDIEGKFVSDNNHADSKSCYMPITNSDYKVAIHYINRIINGVKSLKENFVSFVEAIVS